MKIFPRSRALALPLLASAPFLFPSPPLGAESVPASKPNVVFVLVDDMGWGDLNINWEKHGAAFGNREGRASYKTPQLDRLAEDGMLLLRHYTAAPVSVAARACLITGMHTGHTRQVRDNTFDTPIADVHTLGSVMRSAGYATAVIGKWGVGGGGESSDATLRGRPTRRGFDYFYGHMAHTSGHFHYPANSPAIKDVKLPFGNANAKVELCENDTVLCSSEVASSLSGVYAYSTDLFGARAKRWLADNDPAKTGKPFFLLLTLTAPHASLRVPPCSYPSGGGLSGGLQWTTLEDGTGTCNTCTEALATAAGAEWKGADGFIHPDNAAFGGVHSRHSTMVRRVDDLVGDLRALLDDMGVAENTVIVFTSDNGPHNEPGGDNGNDGSNTAAAPGAQNPTYFKTYGMMDGIKRDCHEGGMREPTIVCWPKRIRAGSVSTRPSQFQDWMATLADMAGVPVPASSSGVSLVPELTGEGERPDSDVYVEYYFNGNGANYADFLPKNRSTSENNQQVVYVDGFKGFLRNLGQNSVIADQTFEIYDTETDPQESTNLAGTRIDAMNDLQARMRAKLLRTRRALDNATYVKTNGGSYAKSDKPYFEQAANAVPADPPRLATPGLAWKLYESDAAFPWVPNFARSRLTPVAAGTLAADAGTAMPDAAKANARAVGVVFEGWIDVPEAGEYVFYLRTDATAGSRAFVHLHDVMPLIDADKLYVAGTEASSYMNVGTAKEQGTKKVLLSAGKHPIRIAYVTDAGNPAPSLAMSWLKPNADAAEAIPASAFSRASDFGTETTALETTSRGGARKLAVGTESGAAADVVVSADADWISVSFDAETGTLSVELEPNAEADARSGTLTISDPETGETQTVAVSQAGAQGYDAWARTEFAVAPPRSDADLAAMEPLESWSGDRVSNLMKYALGLDPTAAHGALGGLAEDAAAGTLRADYPFNPGATDVVFVGERWDDAARAWTSEGVSLVKDAAAGTLAVEAPSPTAEARALLRLRVLMSR
ncbi:sulfatase-like hydrolase/transferase [Candidatus Spyradosoma sp. SGI.093]|uniref:sulfatase-like hydrolase/transferase n=1 Tax=Candidatus Spyradosoma sp. SGI.093 TaxID=3420583 RepID=UPI003D0812E6